MITLPKHFIGICAVILLVLVLSACQSSDEAFLSEINALKAENKELKLTMEKQINDMHYLQVKLDEQIALQPYNQVNAAFEEYPWLKKLKDHSSWDKISVSKYDGDPNEVVIDDPIMVSDVANLFNFRSVGAVHYPSGFQSDIGPYLYKFYDGDDVYKVNVVDRGVIEAGKSELYFEVDPDVHLLGHAFLPKAEYIQHIGLISKMAASGAVQRSNKYAMINAFRVLTKITPVSVYGKKLDVKPANIEGKLETYIFYYYGERLFMDVYQNHVNLHDDNVNEWYHLENAGEILNIEAG